MANPNNTNQGQMGRMGNQGQYGYTGYPGAANQGQWGMQGQPGQMGQMGNQGMYGAPGQMGQTTRMNVPTSGPHAGHGPQNYQRSDQRIKEDVSDRLTAHGHLDARGITVEVKNGEVTLSGMVDSRQAKRMAYDIADGIPGVKDVNNQLKIQQTQQTAQTH